MRLIINRAPEGKLDDGIKAEIEKHGLKLFGVLPHDEAVYRSDFRFIRVDDYTRFGEYMKEFL